VAKADNQTGLASGSSPTWACQEIALGVYGTAVPTPPRVALWDPCGAFPTLNDRHVALGGPWKAPCLRVRVELAIKNEVLVFVVTPQ
jgi:hypothetical protein